MIRAQFLVHVNTRQDKNLSLLVASIWWKWKDLNLNEIFKFTQYQLSSQISQIVQSRTPDMQDFSLLVELKVDFPSDMDTFLLWEE